MTSEPTPITHEECKRAGEEMARDELIGRVHEDFIKLSRDTRKELFNLLKKFYLRDKPSNPIKDMPGILHDLSEEHFNQWCKLVITNRKLEDKEKEDYHNTVECREKKYNDIVIAPYALDKVINALRICGVTEPAVTLADDELHVRWEVKL